MTWNDYGDDKGIVVYDTADNTFERVTLHDPIFHKIIYTDDIDVSTFDYDECKHKIIKIIVEEKNDVFKFDKFCEKLHKQSPFAVDIIEKHLYQTDSDINTDVFDKDTLTILLEAVDEEAGMEIKDQKILKGMIMDIHKEATTTI